MNLKGMTGHIYKKIKALFENAQFQSDTNSAPIHLSLKTSRKARESVTESESGMFRKCPNESENLNILT